MHIDDKHFILNIGAEVSTLAKPIMDFLNLNRFTFCRAYYDGRQISLNTESKWVQRFYEQEYYNMPEAQNTVINDVQLILWDHIPKKKRYY